MPAFIDRTGKRFGMLVVIRRDPAQRGKDVRWVCQCDCGKIVSVIGRHIKTAESTNCGCENNKRTGSRFRTHGQSNTMLYSIWRNMLNRCYYKRHKQYSDYGGRGITVCDRWKTNFATFAIDMGSPPSSRHTIERKDNMTGYCPSNCEWATRTAQGRNKRTNRLIEFNGKTQCISAWAEQIGLPVHTIHSRLRYGWDIARALTTITLTRKGAEHA